MSKLCLFTRPGKASQQGAALVEMSLTISFALLLIFAIIEFSLAVFLFTRGVEATRVGVRFAAVNSPVIDLVSLDCSGGTSSRVEADCSSASCTALVAQMQKILPVIESGNVHIVYECSRIGNPERPIQMPAPEIRVSITGITYDFILPELLGLGVSIDLPAFTSTHSGEDLFTVSTSP